MDLRVQKYALHDLLCWQVIVISNPIPQEWYPLKYSIYPIWKPTPGLAGLIMSVLA